MVLARNLADVVLEVGGLASLITQVSQRESSDNRLNTMPSGLGLSLGSYGHLVAALSTHSTISKAKTGETRWGWFVSWSWQVPGEGVGRPFCSIWGR